MEKHDRLKVINRDAIKYIAVFIMFWGHLFAWITLLTHPEAKTPYSVMPLWQSILSHMSLFCPPVMFFMVTDGFRYTRDRRKYAARLLLFACITQPFDWLLLYPKYGLWSTNVIFTMFFGLLALIAWESGLKKWQRVLLVVLCAGATVLIMSDWCAFGVVFILFLHIFRGDTKKRITAFAVIALLWKSFIVFEPDFISHIADDIADLIVVMAACLCMTVFYNGRKGKHPTFAKWFFYIFYPLHYLIIYLIYIIQVRS